MIAGFLIVYILLVRLAGTYNNYPYGDWHSEIYGDKAGYYIYLPASFLHGFHEESYPEGIEERMGNGFSFRDGKLYVKYPMGVAVLVAPFFSGAHILALTGDGPPDGFSGDYYEMTYYASVFYFLLGSVLLLAFLRRRFTLGVSLSTLALIMFGTNLYYYAFRDPLMSHVYSFALFSLLLLFTDSLWRSPSTLRWLTVVFTGALILLVRPANVLFLPVVLFLGLHSFGEFKTRVRFIFRPLNLALLILVPLLVFTPQMIYWKFLSGSFLFNSYQEEGFTFWDHPQISRVLFSPANGLLTYSPAYFLVLPGALVMFFRREADRWLAPVIFLLLLYMTSSWYAYRFGCGFGQRSYVEYLALFSLPLASLMRWSFRRLYPVTMILILVLVGYLVYVNFGLTKVYQKCHFGEDWEWPPYKLYYLKANLFPFDKGKETYTWTDDFESQAQLYSTRFHVVPFEEAYSGNFVSIADNLGNYSDGILADLGHILTGPIVKVEVGLRCYFTKLPEKANLVCSLDWDGKMLAYHTVRLDEINVLQAGEWNHLEHSFDMEGMPSHGFLKVYVWLIEGDEIYIDDMQVTIR